MYIDDNLSNLIARLFRDESWNYFKRIFDRQIAFIKLCKPLSLVQSKLAGIFKTKKERGKYCAWLCSRRKFSLYLSRDQIFLFVDLFTNFTAMFFRWFFHRIKKKCFIVCENYFYSATSVNLGTISTEREEKNTYFFNLKPKKILDFLILTWFF